MLNDADLSRFSHVYLKCGRTDLRKGIDGLTRIIRDEMGIEPYQKGSLFLFCGGRSDRFKALVYEGDGWLLLYKRVSDGSLRWPKKADEVKDLTPEEYRMLMQGYSIERNLRKFTPSKL